MADKVGGVLSGVTDTVGKTAGGVTNTAGDAGRYSTVQPILFMIGLC